MPQFYMGNSSHAIGGPARVLLVPGINPAVSSYPYSATLSQIFDLSTYLPNTTTYGWVDIGLTKTPTRIQNAATKTDWRSEQFGIFRSSPNDWTAQVTCEALEVTAANKYAIMQATQPPNAASGERRRNFVAANTIYQCRLAVCMIDQFGMIHASVFPKANWDGAAIASTIARGDTETIPMTWTCFPDDQLIDVVTGQAVFRYDFDQESTAATAAATIAWP